MKPFLKEIAEKIFEAHQEDMRNVYIIVPNHRAIVYLKKHFSELTEKPIWAPQMFSIEDFIFQASGLTKCETIDLLFELYAIHRNIADREARSFDEFVRWGEQILNDFNDVDFYLIDPNVLFSYLSESKAIEQWHIDGSEPTENEKKHIEFYQSLSTYYHMLREKMQLEHKAWNGLAYRLMLEHFDKKFDAFSGKPFYLVGFNALTSVEEALFKKIRQNAPTTIFWDADEYYVEHLLHEAGHFFRANRAAFHDDFELPQNFKTPKNITITGIAKNVGQAIAAGRILEQLSDISDDPENTAIVLNNEELLFSVLDFIPEKYHVLNVTMGYPFRLTLLYEFFLSWITMHLTASAQGHFNKKQFLEFLRQPVIQDFLNDSVNSLSENLAASYRNNHPYIGMSEIKDVIFKNYSEKFDAFSFAFESWDNNAIFSIVKIQQMIDFLKDIFSESNNSVNLYFLSHLHKAVNRLQEIGGKYADTLTVKSVFFVFKRILRSIKIPFSGEPIGGLQIMGLLETRLLDYKNVILFSVNEGVIPVPKNNASFISFDIRNQFKLPTHHTHNAISAYYFYRLLQRAENIHIFYNADSNDGTVGSKEQSRFITQLQHEFPKYNPEILITTTTEAPEVDQDAPIESLCIEKTPFAMKRLAELAISGIAPSALNAYLTCPVDFYLNNIVKIPEPLEIVDVIDPATFGTIIHAVIQETHKHLLNKPLVEEDITPILETFKPVLNAQFEKQWNGGDFNSGKNYLKYIVAQDYLTAFLKSEHKEIREMNEKNIPFYIIMQEHKATADLSIQTVSGEQKIRIKGFIDRVERIGNLVRIIDFKTGIVDGINIKNKENFLKEKNSPKAIQILTYAWLMNKGHFIPENCEVEAGFISFRQIGEFQKISIENNTTIDADILNFSETILRQILEELYDPNIPFVPSSHPDAHKYSRFLPLFDAE